MANTSNEEGKILENHVITTTVHEMKVKGYHLVDKKQKTLVDPKGSDGSPKMTIIIHSRSIDDRSYVVQWNLTETCVYSDMENKTPGFCGRYLKHETSPILVETEMTQEEYQRFEEDWCSLWNPIAKADLD